jgi:FixJ family two-component response regulator
MDTRSEMRPERLPEIADTSAEGERGTVFLVDDDEALRRAMVRLLSSCGFRVRAFASSEEFLAQYDRGDLGCLLLDLRMPGRSGLDLQDELARRGIKIPIVFVTGHADTRARTLALAHGAVAFLQKPAREPELLAALDQALSSS